MDPRQDYVVRSTSSEADLAAVCQAVYDALDPRVAFARVEPFSDHAAEMPADIATVHQWLRRRSLEQQTHGIEADVSIVRGEEPGWPYARAFTPWSIRVEVFDAGERIVARFHDCGHTIIANLSDAEARALTAVVPAGFAIEPLLGEAS